MQACDEYYRSDGQYCTTIKSILEDYQSSCLEKENFDVNVFELGIILKEVFPDAKRIQRRVNGARTWLYPINKENVQDQCDLIRWEDLPNFTAELGWQLANRTDHFLEWVKIPSQDLCDGHRVVQEVKIFKDWAFTVNINSREITKETMGILHLGSSKRTIRYFFNVLSQNILCKGFPVPTKQFAKDAKRNTTGITEEWCSHVDGTAVLHLRSLTCQVLLQKNYK